MELTQQEKQLIDDILKDINQDKLDNQTKKLIINILVKLQEK